MQQIQYYNNVIMMSVLERQTINKQIKTHETDTAGHEAYYCR